MFKLSFKQQVLTGFAVSLTFVLISAVTSFFSVKSVAVDAKWQTHTYEVINRTERLELTLLNSETGLRGYILTQRPKYLDPYTQNVGKLIPSIKELKILVADNPAQVQRFDSLELFANAKLADMTLILQANASRGQAAAMQALLTDKGKYYKDMMLEISKRIVAAEVTLLKIRTEATAKSSTQAKWVVLVSAIIIFCLILFLFSYIKTTFDQQKETEEQIRKTNENLALLSAENEEKNWLLSGATLVNQAMRGEQEVDELTTNIITQVCNYIDAPIGAIFLASKRNTLVLSGGYAFTFNVLKPKQYQFGEGLVGQAALEKKSKLISSLPADYVKINSGLGDMLPKAVYLAPIIFESETIALLELGLMETPDTVTLTFIENITENIGVAINSAKARVQLRELFEQTQQQAEELESQQEELRTTNEELMFKSDQLQASEEELRVQQEELRQTNAELEEKAQQLEERNFSVNQARDAMRMKAEELEISSKYKSEFLANMSHELRTPLNSILILARILKENKPENLTADQIKYAGVIHNAGSDLLTLINDILDLSKIESGKIDLSIENVRPAEIQKNMESLFSELAKSKKINFNVSVDHELPEQVTTDLARVEQIVKNLLSNAFKFTPEQGNILLDLKMVKDRSVFHSDQLKTYAGEVFSIAVKDSGIGIPEDKQKLIFEAFQQADGSTSRKYGGTGLGLSISKELAHLLGGEINVSSTAGEGSTFTLLIPTEFTGELPLENEEIAAPVNVSSGQSATRPTEVLLNPELKNVKQKLLIIEDDLVFADVLKDYAIEKGFMPILAHSGDTGLAMAREQMPDAIVLDIMLPVMDGWSILKALKADPATKHIPVHMMSAGDEKIDKAEQEGAIGFLKKPVEKEQLDRAFGLFSATYPTYNFKTVLIIEDQEMQSDLVKQQLSGQGIEVKQAFNGAEALKILEDQIFDCIILDLNLPDISGFDLLDKIKLQPRLAHIPVVINTAMELDQSRMAHIMKYTEAMVLKSNKSNDRLIDEVSLFMNKLKQKDIPVNQNGVNPAAKSVSTIEKALKDKVILVADDDMRNIFALSTALQAYDMQIVIANNGREAIDRLEDNHAIDLVLMDIMMPEMDGYEAMRVIRTNKQFGKIPIIALTAKAMKNDREKCIEAGANDYISKPVDIDKLLSMMRVWLS
ncbi:response regulator [Pedobacter duraquae]|uniref:histidine kinase n=1 Tax=Pedobacter duraquae TaxID=425511 RepID=A0A4V3C3E2_9SPHI|nr:response regulator [Pedobacter duraquae]TDO21748.1 GAF domain-containing protein [Pedobacter duraquae]